MYEFQDSFHEEPYERKRLEALRQASIFHSENETCFDVLT